MNALERKIKSTFPNEEIEVIDYTIMKQPATVKCKRCNTNYTLTRAENFIRKDKNCICKKCINNKSGGKLDLKEFQEKINEKYPQEELEVLEYTLRTNPCKIKCLKCNNIIELQNAGSFLFNHKKFVCHECHKNKQEIIDKKIEEFKDWIKNQEIFLFFPIPEDIHSHTLILAKCKTCNTITKKTMYDYLRGRGCGKCSNNVLKSLKDYQDEIGEEYTVIEYNGMNNTGKFKHNLCGFIYDRNARHYTCPRCSGSKGEKAIRFFLEKHKILFEEQKIYKIDSHKLRVDFYLPVQDLVIEFNGLQHFEPISFFGGEEQFNLQQKYDNLKRKYFKEKLIEIKYDEYDKISEILTNLLL